MFINNTIILGVDPGTNILGYAIIKTESPTPRVLKMDVLNSSACKNYYEKLGKIHGEINEIINLYKPSFLAIEAPFYGKNVQSMLKLGRAQGIVIATAMFHKIPVIEYSPKKIKLAITGNGNSSKEQVWKMLAQIFNLEHKPEFMDASDALAIALCHYYNGSSTIEKIQKRKTTDWKSFINQNPQLLTKK
ncbi:MAG: crossover junction endodeoxyribonuclease RuvC [Sediminibacterium sp.]|nr:crossover junction endodeoxyribonuclease RuvC [Sediminibacterium sp.]